MVKIFVIEDHPVVVSGVKTLFRPFRDEITVEASAGNVDEFLKIASTVEFDLTLLDLYIPGYAPLDNVKRIKTVFPDKPIVIFTSEDREVWKYKMMNAGVHAFLNKNSDKEDLKFTLKKAARGEYCFLGNKYFVPEDHPYNRSSYTQHQLKIVALLSEGKNQLEISKIQGTSKSNIEKTLAAIRQKANIKTNMELVRLFVELGYI